MGFGFSFSLCQQGNALPPTPPTAAPTNTMVPAITGLAQSGSQLSSNYGAWTQSPSSYLRQWKADGESIVGATARTYVLTDAEIGKAITVTVTATNSFGSAGATSTATTLVTAKPITVKPAITSAPVVTGDALVGSILMTSDGTWANSPTSFSYQWFRNGTALSGATANFYALFEEDIGGILRADVTATNVVGSTTASTNNVGPIIQGTLVPENVDRPSISGTARVGSTLTAWEGTWLNDPTSFAYQWRRSGSNIAGATGTTYLLTPDDAARFIGLNVTASNSAGSEVASAVQTARVESAPAIKIVADGDSLTDGYMTPSPTTMNYPYVTVNSLLTPGPTYSLENLATPGIGALEINAYFDSRGEAAFDPGIEMNVFTIMAGHNDKAADPARTDNSVYVNLRKILKKAKDTGYQRRLVSTIISTDNPDTGNSWSGATLPLNEWIRDYGLTDLDADGVIDFGGDSRFDTTADTFDFDLYNEDHIHLTENGNLAMASIYAPALELAFGEPPEKPPLPATWFPPDTSKFFVLSNGNRTVNWPEGDGGASANVRGGIGKTNGQWYFETLIDVMAWNCVGLMNEAFTDTILDNSMTPMQTANTIAYATWAGAIQSADETLVELGGIEDGTVICHAVDLETRRYWMRFNDGPWNGGAPEGAPAIDPATGVGGLDISGLGTGMIYPVACIWEGGKITSRFAPGETTQSIPSGFQVLGA